MKTGPVTALRLIFFFAVSIQVKPQVGPSLTMQSAVAVSMGSFSGDASMFLTHWANELHLWNVRSGLLVQRLTHGSQSIISASFCSSTVEFVSLATDGEVVRWNARTGFALSSVRPSSANASPLALSPNCERVLLSLPGEGRAFWNLRDNSIKKERFSDAKVMRANFGVTSDLSVASVLTFPRAPSFSPDGRRVYYYVADVFTSVECIVVGSTDKPLQGVTCGARGEEIVFWSLSPNNKLGVVGLKKRDQSISFVYIGDEGRGAIPFKVRPSSVVISDDGVVAALDSAGSIHTWSTRDSSMVELRLPDRLEAILGFAPNQREVLAISRRDEAWLMVDLANNSLTRRQSRHSNVLKFGSLNRTGDLMAYTGGDGSVHVVQTRTWIEVDRFTANGTANPQFAFDGRLVFTANGTVFARNIVLHESTTLAHLTSQNQIIILSPNGGKIIASGLEVGNSGTIVVKDLRTGREDVLEPAQDQSVPRAIAARDFSVAPKAKDQSNVIEYTALSPEGKYAVVAYTRGVVEIRNLEDGSIVKSLPRDQYGHSLVRVVGNETVLMSASGNVIRLLNLDTGEVIWQREIGKGVGAWFDHSITSLSAFANDTRAVTTSRDGIARVWDMSSGILLYELGATNFDPADPLLLQAIALPEGRFLLIGFEKISLWQANPPKRLAYLCVLDGGSLEAIAPDGRFSGPLSDRFLTWVVPDDPFNPLPVEIFTRDYYTPKLLAKLVSGVKLPDVRPLASLNRSQPKVTVVGVYPEPDFDRVTVSVKLTSAPSKVQRDAEHRTLQSGAYDLRLFRDGQLVGQSPGGANGEMSASSVDGLAELDRWRRQHRILSDGETVISIPHVQVPHRKGVSQVVFTAYAFNSDRVKSEISEPFPYEVRVSQPRGRRAYLITMTVNANQSGPGWDLKLAVPSGELAAQLWTKKLLQDYEVVPVILKSETDDRGVVLPNPTATKSSLQAVLDILAGREQRVSAASREAIDPKGRLRTATPDDAVVLYVASHGYADPQGKFYVIPFDTPPRRLGESLLNQCAQRGDSVGCSDAQAFLNHSVSSYDLGSWWQGVDAGELVMILDSCHSAAVPGQGFRAGPLGDPGFGQLSFDKGMRILAATQPDKTAIATEGLGHTLLVEALKNALQDRMDQSITAWLEAAERQLPTEAHKLAPNLKLDDLQLPEFMNFRHERPEPKP